VTAADRTAVGVLRSIARRGARVHGGERLWDS
jgi:hypothetical protein